MREPFDPSGRERPGFILNFPENNAKLERLIQLFELGDYSTLRKEAPLVLQETDQDAVKSAVAELVRRTDPDPVVKAMLAVSVVCFIFLVAWSYW